MSSKMPLVPPENRNPKLPREARQSETDAELRGPDKPADPEKQGQQGNSRINTTHQGYQQDR